jgi:hypothetical protein
MRKVLIFVIFIIGLLVIILFTYPKFKEMNIKIEIEQANYCIIDSDCVNAGNKCPFGCYNYVNVNEIERVSELINSYSSNCVYGCVFCEEVKCINNKCEEICE